MGEKITRDIAREKYKSLGLRYTDVSIDQISILKLMLSERFKTHDDGSYKIEKGKKVDYCFDTSGCLKHAYIKMRGSYFRNREAISFNFDNNKEFIGFAGWADNENIIPILETFIQWLEVEFNLPQGEA